MTGPVCATLDVESFADGMAVLGHDVGKRSVEGDLLPLLERLDVVPGRPRITLFVVGAYAKALGPVLEAFLAAGHEVASHGPDHGRLPERDVPAWLRQGRDMLEEAIQVRVRGFRSPRFDVPAGDLARFRDDVAAAGFAYVSDASRLGPGSPVVELPVLRWHGVPVGGGSYQRVLPAPLVRDVISRSEGPAVLYYHSYDFDGSLPSLRSVRSPAVAKQVLLRRRIASGFERLVATFGSRVCADAAT